MRAGGSAISPSRLDMFAVRMLDIGIASCALIFLGPLLLMVAGLIYIVGPGPILTRHRRFGRDGRGFACLRFRSRVNDTDQWINGRLATGQGPMRTARDSLMASLGNILRRTSIDGLPQLINVLRGDMSVVGPRPILQCEIELYGRYYADYSRVRPGLIGLWQISGRDDRRRVALDVSYARNKCLTLDLRILMMTVPAMLFANGNT